MNLAIDWIGGTESLLKGEPMDSAGEKAVIRFFELASEEPAKAVELVLQVLAKHPPERIINCLGAGPVEELLVKHPVFLEVFIDLANNNDDLRQCLHYVDLDDAASLKRLNEYLEQ